MSYSEKMSSINLLQTKGLEGLAVSSRFSKSAIKKKKQNKTKQKNNKENNRERNCCPSSHSDAMSLYEVSFVELERILFKNKTQKFPKIVCGNWH